MSDPIQIEYLVFCPNLKSLTILDNPIDYDSFLQESETTADVQIRNRHIVCELIPQLEILDDIPLEKVGQGKYEAEIKESEISDPIVIEKQIALKKPIEIEKSFTAETRHSVDKPVRRRPASVAMIQRPEPPKSSIISTKQISILRARVQARLAEQPKKLVIDIPESDKQIKLKPKIPMPPIKSSQSLQTFTVPVPPAARRSQSFRHHSRVSTVTSS